MYDNISRSAWVRRIPYSRIHSLNKHEQQVSVFPLRVGVVLTSTITHSAVFHSQLPLQNSIPRSSLVRNILRIFSSSSSSSSSSRLSRHYLSARRYLPLSLKLARHSYDDYDYDDDDYDGYDYSYYVDKHKPLSSLVLSYHINACMSSWASASHIIIWCSIQYRYEARIMYYY